MIIKFSPAFYEKLKKLDVRIQKGFKERILLFSKKSYEPVLNNHPLKNEYAGYRSINITSDRRALYQEKQEGSEKVAYFAIIGTHKELYGKSSI